MQLYQIKHKYFTAGFICDENNKVIMAAPIIKKHIINRETSEAIKILQNRYKRASIYLVEEY